jgi:hypothetical protein
MRKQNCRSHIKQGINVFCLLLFPLIVNSQSYVSNDTTSNDTIKYPRLYVSVGGYFPTINTSLKINSDKLGIGSTVVVEDVFNLPSDLSVFRFNALLHVKKRSQFDFYFISLDRKSENILDRDINFKDSVFHANAKINSYFNAQYYAATWRYSFFNKPSWNAGITVGARWLQIGTGLSFESTNNIPAYSQSVDVGVPTILFGVHGAAYLTPKLLGRYTFEYFQLTIKGIKATVADNRFSLEYYFFKKFGAGFSFASTEYKVVELPLLENFDGEIKFRFSGFAVFLTARF